MSLCSSIVNVLCKVIDGKTAFLLLHLSANDGGCIDFGNIAMFGSAIMKILYFV